MRSLLLATVAAISLASPQAHAQWTVIDPAHILETVEGRVQQARQFLQEMEELRRHYMMFQRTYNALSGATDVGDIASALGGVTRTYMPEASGTLSTISQGSRLYESMTRNRSANTLYTQIPAALRGTRSAERWLEEMQRREAVTAHAQAVGQAGVAEMAQRIAALQAAQAAISTAPTLQSLAAANGLIAAGGQNIAAQQAQIASVQLALHAEDRIERQRAEQARALGAAEWGEQTQWAVDALGR